MLGLRPSCEKVGEVFEVILGFSCCRAEMTLKDMLDVSKREESEVCSTNNVNEIDAENKKQSQR